MSELQTKHSANRLSRVARYAVNHARLRLPTYEELQTNIAKGAYQVHSFARGEVVTEILDYDTERVLVVHLLAGEGFTQWAGECVQRLRDFARAHDCIAIEALCRPGLAAMLKGIGWRTRNVQMRIAV